MKRVKVEIWLEADRMSETLEALEIIGEVAEYPYEEGEIADDHPFNALFTHGHQIIGCLRHQIRVTLDLMK